MNPSTSRPKPLVPAVLALAWLASSSALLAGTQSTGDFEMPLTSDPVADESGWKFAFGLNLWGPDLTATTSSGASVELGVDDIFDDLKMAFMASFVAEKDRWFIGTDMIYMDLAQTLTERRGPVAAYSDVDLSAWIVTPAVGYRALQGDWGHFDLMAGARYLYIDVDANLTVSDPLLGTATVATSESGHEWAGIVGFKGHYNLSPKWYVPFYFDIGAGDPDLTLQAYLGLGYRAGQFDVSLGYRYLKFDLESGSPVSELVAKGPMLGIYFGC